MDANQIPAATLLAQAPDAVIFAGTDGNIRTWNAAAERLFCFDEAGALGQSLDIIVPEAFREPHWTAYDKALEAGSTKYAGQSLPTRAQRADGSTFYVELTF